MLRKARALLEDRYEFDLSEVNFITKNDGEEDPAHI
jgi:hypothetical protein